MIITMPWPQVIIKSVYFVFNLGHRRSNHLLGMSNTKIVKEAFLLLGLHICALNMLWFVQILNHVRSTHFHLTPSLLTNFSIILRNLWNTQLLCRYFLLWYHFLKKLAWLLKIKILGHSKGNPVVVLLHYVHILILTHVYHLRVIEIQNWLLNTLDYRILALITDFFNITRICLVHVLGDVILHIDSLVTHSTTFVFLNGIVLLLRSVPLVLVASWLHRHRFILQIIGFFLLSSLLGLWLMHWSLSKLFHFLPAIKKLIIIDSIIQIIISSML